MWRPQDISQSQGVQTQGGLARVAFWTIFVKVWLHFIAES